MKNSLKKMGILLGIFIVALTVYFVWDPKIPEKTEDTVYTNMEEASLPVVYTEIFGMEMNALHGYRQDMKGTVSREVLTVLPEDRNLQLRIESGEGAITGISYEVRNLAMDHLVERTQVTQWDTEGSRIGVVLPIQNLLVKEQEYVLILTLNTTKYESVLYYTRIKMCGDIQSAGSMVDFARDFSKKTFDYDQARELTMYLETDSTADNTSLGQVNIKSSFSQITWAGLDMVMSGEPLVTIKDMDGIMGNVTVSYQAVYTDKNGTIQTYEVEDNFTMRWNSKRIYLMDFNRQTNQIFSGAKELFTDRQIIAGITNEGSLSGMESESKEQVAFVVNRDLWYFDKKERTAVKIFSFLSGTERGVRSGYDQHNVKVLSVGENGDLNFIVYGYMNRGIHEGCTGISLYQYVSQDNAVREHLFIPVNSGFEQLESDLKTLSYLGENQMLYFKVEDKVYGVDISGNEYMILADNLEEGTFAVSRSGSHLAWQEGSRYDSSIIHLMNLNTGIKKDIGGKNGEVYQTLGFVGDDFIYGVSNENEQWILNGRVRDFPMYRLEIMDEESNIVKKYEVPEIYISDVTVEDSRIHLERVVKTGENQYVSAGRDTIVCNESLKLDSDHLSGWYISPEYKKIFFIQLGQQEENKKTVRITVPKKLSYELSEKLELEESSGTGSVSYYAYGGGKLLGNYNDFSKAVNAAYEKMGVVTNQNREIIWNRINRGIAKNIKEPQVASQKLTIYLEDFKRDMVYDNAVQVIDARGCSLNQMLYFIDRGCPVVAYTSEGAYVLLYGYDQYNVSVCDPETGEVSKMGLNDGAAYFDSMGNDFICGVFYE